MSKKEPSGCGFFLGLLLSYCCFGSLFGAVYGQSMKNDGSLECDWTVIWMPAIVFWSALVLVFALVGLAYTVKVDK